MEQAAKTFYNSINFYSDLERLVDEGESESLFLECKSPAAPTLNSDLRKTLAKALSGFSNTNGGVIIWGASTVKKSHSGLDIINQIEPLGNCTKFQREIENRIPTLTTPSIYTFETKIIKKKESDTCGVVLTFIPRKIGDPVQSVEDEYFYFRSGDDFVKTPYEMIKRLFAAAESPDLSIEINERLVKIDEKGFWSFPLSIGNDSSAVAEKIKIFIVIENFMDCEKVLIDGFTDVSGINPQFPKSLIYDLDGYVYKGLNTNLGNVSAKLKRNKRNLNLRISLYAPKMVSKDFRYKITLIKNKFTAQLLSKQDRF